MSNEFIYETKVVDTIYKTDNTGWTYDDIDLSYSFDMGNKKWGLPLEPSRVREEHEIVLQHILDKKINTYIETNPLILIDKLKNSVEWQYDNHLFTVEFHTPFSGSILPIAQKVASKAMGLNLVAVKPLSAPKANLMYMDYKYDDSPPQHIEIDITVTSSEHPLIIASHNYEPSKKPVKKWKRILNNLIKKAKSIF